MRTKIITLISIVGLLIIAYLGYAFNLKEYLDYHLLDNKVEINNNIPEDVSFEQSLNNSLDFSPFGEYEDENIKVSYHNSEGEDSFCKPDKTPIEVIDKQIIHGQPGTTGGGSYFGAFACTSVYYIHTFSSAEGPRLYGPFKRE